MLTRGPELHTGDYAAAEDRSAKVAYWTLAPGSWRTPAHATLLLAARAWRA